MSEKLHKWSPETVGFESPDETIDEFVSELGEGVRLATDEEKNIAADFVRNQVGADPEKTDHSVYVKLEETKDEEGNVTGAEVVAKAAWIKARAKNQIDMTDLPPIEPAVIKSTRIRNRPSNRKSDKVALIIPDMQIGYRNIDGEPQSIHDLQALEVAHMLARHIQPDKIIFNGDNIDLPNLSRHGADPAAMGTTNISLQQNHNEMAQFRADAPNAEMAYLFGNHEDRFMRYLREHAPELAGVRCASANKAELGRLALSFAQLINADHIEMEVIGNYPGGKYWLNDRLKVIHGKEIESDSGKMTAAKIIKKDPFSSTIFGHIHRIEQAHRTVEDGRRGAKQVSSHSFGTLARIDGGVPSANWSRDERDAPVESYENWQHGVGVVEYREGDHPFQVTAIPIHTHDGYVALHDGREFRPSR